MAPKNATALAVVPSNPSAAADAIMAEAGTEAWRAQQLAAAKVTFADFGRRAGSGQVTTEMAFTFAQLCLDGIATFANAPDLYEPYAEAYSASVPDGESKLIKGSDSYASALSIFATFGLEGAVSIQQEVGLIYADIRAAREALESKKGVDSAYSLYAKANRAFKEVGTGEKRDQLVARLKDADGRKAWCAEFVAPKVAEPKTEVERLKRIEADLVKCFKKSTCGEGSVAHKRYTHVVLHLGLLVAEMVKADADAKLGELIKREAAGNA